MCLFNAYPGTHTALPVFVVINISLLLLLLLLLRLLLLLFPRYASFQMALCAIPAVVIMNLRPHALPTAAAAASKLSYVWLGLSLVMSFRALSIWAPYKLNLAPFRSLGPVAKQQQNSSSNK